MMISRSNYEIYFVDYFDGTLDERVKAELFDFLANNPDLKEEFEQFEFITASAEKNVSFRGKDFLKKDVPSLKNYKTWLIAEFENDLSEQQIHQLDNFISNHTDIAAERTSMKNLRLVPDDITFPGKRQLKRAVVLSMRINIARVVSVAAVVALLLLGYFFVYRSPKQERMMAHKNEIVPEGKKENENQKMTGTPATHSQNENSVLRKDTAKRATGMERKFQFRKKELAPVYAEEKNSEEEKNADTVTHAIAPEVISNPVAEGQKTKERPSGTTLADVFDEGELEEMSASNPSKDQTLPDIALKEVERISGVKVEANKNDGSMTYALSVRNVFSISHSTNKER